MKLLQLNILLKYKYHIYIFILMVSTCLSETIFASNLNKNEDLSQNNSTVVGWMKSFKNDYTINSQRLDEQLSLDPGAIKNYFCEQPVEVINSHKFGYDLPESSTLELTKRFMVYLNLAAAKSVTTEPLQVLVVAAGLARNVP